MQQEVKPRLTFWNQEHVESMKPEYIFNVSKKYQNEEVIEDVNPAEESQM